MAEARAEVAAIVALREQLDSADAAVREAALKAYTGFCVSCTPVTEPALLSLLPVVLDKAGDKVREERRAESGGRRGWLTPAAHPASVSGCSSGCCGRIRCYVEGDKRARDQEGTCGSQRQQPAASRRPRVPPPSRHPAAHNTAPRGWRLSSRARQRARERAPVRRTRLVGHSTPPIFHARRVL